ncbi:FUSC family protein [Ignatzschineria rhizosphaerae]|uniref:FUSC family protein n=1 Tax=Ignatzschineria rhizosphaerae TaxID=2923279 RepID=A0ABY3WY57_9GAMM|nr:FUSC family protein [Ignatzschineria rhizosphaerae]UNM95548.1 FUSC family protein [Ignatzschineria rhizosphaerae]
MKGAFRKISWQSMLQYLAGLNYSHACRMVLGMGLAWFIAFRLQTDKPYWAMMTVAIVTLPMQRMLVENFLARFIGTVLGVISVNIIAALALNDQWLFVIYMAIWLAICSYLASSLSRLFTYGFALCGYTAALIGFTLSVAPSSYALFQISQARILEIYIGLATAFFISMLWPAFSERIEIKRKLREKRTQARRLYQSLLTVDNDHHFFYKEYRAALLGLMDFRDLIFYEFLSASSNSAENTRLYRYGHRLLHAISGILLLDMLKRELLKDVPEVMTQYLSDLKRWFSSASLSQGKLAHKPKAPSQLLQNDKGRHFVALLDEKLDEILSAQYRYEHGETSSKAVMGGTEDVADFPNLKRRTFYIPGFKVYYSDKKEALLNAVRTFLCIMTGMFFWMETQWDFGFVLLILIGIICTIGATLSMVTKAITMMLSAMMLVAIPISFILKFGILIQVSTMEVAMLIVLPIYFIAALLQGRSVKGILIGLGVLIFSPMLVSFSNPMEFDISTFANTSLTMVVAFVILLLMFNIIRPSSSEAKLARVRLSIFKQFKRLMQPEGASQFTLKRPQKIHQHLAANISEKSLRDYEAYVYSAIHQVRLLPDNTERSLFVIYAYLTLAILRGQLRFKHRGELWYLPAELLAALEAEDLEAALVIVMVQKEKGNEHEKLAYWELQCALMALQEFLGTSAEK